MAVSAFLLLYFTTEALLFDCKTHLDLFFFLFLYSSHLDLITISDGCSNLAFRCRNTWLDCSINF